MIKELIMNLGVSLEIQGTDKAQFEEALLIPEVEEGQPAMVPVVSEAGSLDQILESFPIQKKRICNKLLSNHMALAFLLTRMTNQLRRDNL